jgi:hypothetical protein
VISDQLSAHGAKAAFAATFQRRKTDDLEVAETATRRERENRRIASAREIRPTGGVIAENCDLWVVGSV